MNTKTSIFALVKLMDDPDNNVVSHAKNVLLQQEGGTIINILEKLEGSFLENPVITNHITDVLRVLRFRKIKSELQNWIHSKDKKLEQALYTICLYQFPDLKHEEFTKKIDEIKTHCEKTISHRQTSFEKVESLNKIIFDQLNFHYVNRDNATPFDVLINSVIEMKEGIGLSIGLIYSIVAQSLNIPIYGVTTNNNTPFFLAYLDQNNLLPVLDWEIDNNGVLFYINIKTKGSIITPINLKTTYISLLNENKISFNPSPNSLIVKQFLIELKKSYTNHHNFNYKLKEITELISLF